MARALTANEVTLYRTNRFATRALFAIPEYHTIYTAELDSVPSSNDEVGEITFVSGSGTLSDVLADMTLYVGTSAGAYDLGMCRIRKVPISGTFYIGEISEVDFNYGGTIYLTVVDDYSIWAKPVKLSSGVAKMDYDIDYSDQHTNFDPVGLMGCHRVGKLVNGTVDITLGPADDTASYCIGSSISARSWSCASGSFDDSTAANPVLTLTACGTYLVYCNFTAGNGKTFKGVRYVIVYDDDHPLYEGELKNWNYDHQNGGLTFGVEMYAALEVDIRKRSLVIVVTEDTVDNQAQSFPCPIDGAENILCVGWIGKENIVHNQVTGSVEFTCYNSAQWLKDMEGYLSGIEFKVGTSDDWTNCSTLTVRKMLFHFLHWRTTCTRIMDVVLTDDTRYAVGFKTITGRLWEQLVSIGNDNIFASPGVDRFNRLFIEIEQQMVPEVDRTGFPEIMDVDNQDWIGGVRVLDELPRISMLYFSGISVDASANPLAYVSLAPGHIHGRYGHSIPVDNLLVSSQSNCNQLASLYYGWQNNLKEFELNMGYSHRMIDMWPRQYINLTITASEDPRGIGYAGRAILRRVESRHDAKNGVLMFSHFYEPETFEGLAINGDVPDSSTDDLAGLPKIPPIKPIPLVPLTLPVIPGDVPADSAPKRVMLTTTNKGILYTIDGGTHWLLMNGGLTSTQYNDVTGIVKTPGGALFAVFAEAGLYYATGLGDIWTLIATSTDLGAGIVTIGVNPEVDEQIAVIANRYIWLGDRSGVTQGGFGIHASPNYAPFALTYQNGKWVAVTTTSPSPFANQYYGVYDADGSLLDDGTFPLGQTVLASAQRSVSGGGIVYSWNNDSSYLRKIEDNDPSTSDTTQPNVGGDASAQVYSCDPSGQYLIGGKSTALGWKSSDFGASWGNISALLGIGYKTWENAGSSMRWMAATTQVVKYSLDFGDSWDDMSGDLATIAPLCVPRHLKFIGD